MRHTFLRRGAAIFMLGTLAACGGAAEPDGTAQSASPSPYVSAAAASIPPASVAASTGAGAVASVQASTSVAASLAASADTAPSVAADGPYAGLPQSKTPEGYYVLGDTNAPVTLTFYSDFI